MPWASLRRSFPQAKCGPSVLGVDEMSGAAMRFAERNDLPEAFATLVACCDEKRRRIRAASATRRQALADRASTMSPRIGMRIGAGTTDEFGNLSRIVWNAEDEVPLP